MTICYGMDDREIGVRVLVGLRIFSSPRRQNWPTQPPIQWVPVGKAAGA
jgi:hypothetical protein